MTVVADASVVVAYLLGEGSDVERRAMLDDVHAPSLVDVEVTQTLRGLLRGSKIDLATADNARVECLQLALRRHPDAALLGRAWALRDVCTTYDALYVALAQALGAWLLTRDARLARGVAGLVHVVGASK
ncbi:MAG: type II toxin-antitoxin system VapC family toxin [Solirubrobacteraceae bacterium MAG38_C4-C5]|nr:type II toxin-antitoxin system VapC family toxin [Candidatus Siliceabacter maunaloa]